MVLRYYTLNKQFLIDTPPGSRVIRRDSGPESDGPVPLDLLLVRWQGRSIPIYAEPEGLLPELARSGRYGLKIVGEKFVGPAPTMS